MNQENEISIIRVYDAPLEKVWDAWVDEKKVAQWWGPRGFTLTSKHKDVRTGGEWIYTMHGPDGVDYPNHTKFLEVEKYSRLVYDHGGSVDRKPMFRVTVFFSESAGKTKMEMAMALPTPEAAVETRKFIKQAGGDATWDRLAEFLAPTDRFVIHRSFEASLEQMFKMWTDPNRLEQWLPPTGTEMGFSRAEIKVGGSSFYWMSGANGKIYGRANYLEIAPPNRLRYTQQFCDENEKITRHPMATTWPETMLTTVEFSEEDGGRTRVAVTWEVYGDATPTEKEAFSKAKAGMAQGWTGSFDKLEETL